MTQTMTVAVTGASGFVGRHIVRALVEQGHTVRALIRNREKGRTALGGVGGAAGEGAVEWVIGDVFDRKAMAELATDAGVMVHTIGIRREFHPEVTFARMHPGATRVALAAAENAGAKRFIHISALGTRPNAASEYHRSKFESESLVRRSGLAWTILRPSLIHGPDGEFMQMIKGWVLGRSAPWFFIPYFARIEHEGKPRMTSATVQPVGVDEVAQAVLRVLNTDQSIGEVYPLGGAETLDWPTLLAAIRDAMPITDRKKKIIGLPGPVGWAKAVAAEAIGMGSMLPFGPSEPIMATEDSVCSLVKAREHLGFEPKGFRESLASYASSI